MPGIRHILCTTDFTESGDRAIGWAFELAAQNNARVTLCHVLTAIPPPNSVYAQLYPKSLFTKETLEGAERNAIQALRDRVPKERANTPHDIAVSHGSAADEIVRHAEEQGCDVIVCAAGRRPHLLGSVAEKVVRRALCSVVVVR